MIDDGGVLFLFIFCFYGLAGKELVSVGRVSLYTSVFTSRHSLPRFRGRVERTSRALLAGLKQSVSFVALLDMPHLHVAAVTSTELSASPQASPTHKASSLSSAAWNGRAITSSGRAKPYLFQVPCCQSGDGGVKPS